MPAYYVRCGSLDVKIMANNNVEACRQAIIHAYNKNELDNLSLIMTSDERGTFIKSETKVIPTISVLKQCNLDHLFNTDVIDFLFSDDDLDLEE